MRPHMNQRKAPLKTATFGANQKATGLFASQEALMGNDAGLCGVTPCNRFEVPYLRTTPMIA